jgi:D-sedoheptulose 7-phosphate isomerase
MNNEEVLSQLFESHPQLAGIKDAIHEAVRVITKSYSMGGKLLVCGNGGSCSDSDHIVGELMKSFEQKRPIGDGLKDRLFAIGDDRGLYIANKLQQGLPAISLTAQSALITAIGNDIDSDLIFAQQVTVYGNSGDVLIGISTSGNSRNVIDALISAKAKGMITIGLTGKTGGEMKPFCDVLIHVPGQHTAVVQELHLPVYHAICRMVENHFFG